MLVNDLARVIREADAPQQTDPSRGQLEADLTTIRWDYIRAHDQNDTNRMAALTRLHRKTTALLKRWTD